MSCGALMPKSSLSWWMGSLSPSNYRWIFRCIHYLCWLGCVCVCIQGLLLHQLNCRGSAGVCLWGVGGSKGSCFRSAVDSLQYSWALRGSVCCAQASAAVFTPSNYIKRLRPDSQWHLCCVQETNALRLAGCYSVLNGEGFSSGLWSWLWSYKKHKYPLKFTKKNNIFSLTIILKEPLNSVPCNNIFGRNEFLTPGSVQFILFLLAALKLKQTG